MSVLGFRGFPFVQFQFLYPPPSFVSITPIRILISRSPYHPYSSIPLLSLSNLKIVELLIKIPLELSLHLSASSSLYDRSREWWRVQCRK